MIDIIIAVILVIVAGLAVFYIWKAKKSGRKCIGCSCCGTDCSKSCGGSCCGSKSK